MQVVQIDIFAFDLRFEKVAGTFLNIEPQGKVAIVEVEGSSALPFLAIVYECLHQVLISKMFDLLLEQDFDSLKGQVGMLYRWLLSKQPFKMGARSGGMQHVLMKVFCEVSQQVFCWFNL